MWSEIKLTLKCNEITPIKLYYTHLCVQLKSLDPRVTFAVCILTLLCRDEFKKNHFIATTDDTFVSSKRFVTLINVNSLKQSQYSSPVL